MRASTSVLGLAALVASAGLSSCASDGAPVEPAADDLRAGARAQVMATALSLGQELSATYASEGTYPPNTDALRLTPGTHVGSYSAGTAGVIICVVNDQYDAWAVYRSDAGAITSSGLDGATCR